ncbi:MAG: hexose kinase [Actinomyces sp.]|uniref:1-phosphofructokinase family hexose kinase n=1 Tax=Actinomyces sp. TaxID=29317 RepID=UPI0026DBA3C9|nr:hexose kinase [Actinomyces sp.]MDO4243302.1 hexose kinase [Actinomyces sp.]
MSTGSVTGRVIVVTPNPAVDVTYEVATPRMGTVNRVARVARRPGGKGINVASVLHQLRGIGADAPELRLGGFLGGSQGQELQEALEDWGLEQRWVDPGGAYRTRSTVVVRDADGGATGFYEPGSPVTAHDWQALASTVLDGAGPGDVLVVAGSCPPGTRAEELAGLLQAARALGVRTVLDTSGPLLLACAGGADLLKPNLEELTEATGEHDPRAGAEILLRAGARGVVVSDGPRGMHLLSRVGATVRSWHAAPPPVEVVNPTGAGDAAVAALAAHLAARPGTEPVGGRALEVAVALSAAAVRTPVAGLVDPDTYTTLLHQVKAEDTDAAD